MHKKAYMLACCEADGEKSAAQAKLSHLLGLPDWPETARSDARGNGGDQSLKRALVAVAHTC
jgi:hypothetical protein